jgi:ferredoxin
MITAERKPMDEIMESIDGCSRILLVGCNECVTVCAAGGRKEVALLASALQMASMKKGRTLDVREMTLERQCDPEYVEELAPHIDQVDAVVSMACGCGVQEVARRFKKPVLPGSEHQVHGGFRRARDLGRAVPGLRRLPAGPHRRHLPHRPLCQAPDERALRRLHRRQM